MNITDTHKWVTYYNPRNGKVKIKACQFCGVSFSKSVQARDCEDKKPSVHVMDKMGWKILGRAQLLQQSTAA